MNLRHWNIIRVPPGDVSSPSRFFLKIPLSDLSTAGQFTCPAERLGSTPQPFKGVDVSRTDSSVLCTSSGGGGLSAAEAHSLGVCVFGVGRTDHVVTSVKRGQDRKALTVTRLLLSAGSGGCGRAPPPSILTCRAPLPPPHTCSFWKKLFLLLVFLWCLPPLPFVLYSVSFLVFVRQSVHTIIKKLFLFFF